MHYYTNVQKYKDFILVRGIKNGKRYIKRLKYEPTLYIPTNKQSAFKSVKGEFLQAKKFGSINHAFHWKKKFKLSELRLSKRKCRLILAKSEKTQNQETLHTSRPGLMILGFW